MACVLICVCVVCVHVHLLLGRDQDSHSKLYLSLPDVRGMVKPYARTTSSEMELTTLWEDAVLQQWTQMPSVDAALGDQLLKLSWVPASAFFLCTTRFILFAEFVSIHLNFVDKILKLSFSLFSHCIQGNLSDSLWLMA